MIAESSQAERLSVTFMMGDLNVNNLNVNEAADPKDIMEIHGLFNMCEPVCLNSHSETTTLLEVILTNTKKVGYSLKIGNGLSNIGNFMFQHPETIATKMAKHDDVTKWKYFPRYWTFVRGIPRAPMNSPHKGLVMRTLMFLWCAPT